MKLQGLTYKITTGALRAALVLALTGAGWEIYRQLPEGGGTALDGAERASATALRIVLRRTTETRAETAEIHVHLYSIDVSAAQREFFSERRAGLRFEDFVTQRMGGKAPITAQLDARGQTTVSVPPGKWWIHATLWGTPEVTWRLPVNVAGREQTVELTPENAYTRTRSF